MIAQTFAAIKVLLGHRGFGWMGSTHPTRSVEHLRRSVWLDHPFNFELSYLANGESAGPRVLLIHGTPGSADGWANYLESPPPNVEVVAVDRPGFGHSGPHGAVARLIEQAEVVATLLATGDRTTILVGHSLGGAIAALVAAENTLRVSALVLIAASLDPSLERIHPMQYVATLPLVRRVLPRAIHNANEELIMLKSQLEALSEKLAKIQIPVFILHGTSDALVPVKNVAFAKHTMRNADCIHIELLRGGNHFLPWNSVGAIREILDRAIVASSSC